MRTWKHSAVLGAAIVAAFAAAANADSTGQPVAAPQVAAVPTVTLPPVNVNPNHFTVPAGYDADVSMHPYTSGIGPCTEGASPSQGCHHDTGHPIPPSHYEQAPFNR